MKLRKKALPAALCALAGMGFAGQASADVYGLGRLFVTDLQIVFDAAGGPTFFTFGTGASAALNGAPDPVDGGADCNIATCVAGNPVLSGTVQNAPGGGGVVRGENDYAIYGTGVGGYSNAESAIVSAQLVTGSPTSTSQISEANLSGLDTSALADTTVNSNTTLSLTFEVSSAGSFSVAFDAALDLLAAVTDASVGSSGVTSDLNVSLSGGGVQYVNWDPDGAESDPCSGGATCTVSEDFAVNNGATASVGDTPNGISDSGAFSLFVEGLPSGTYTLLLSAGTDLILGKIAEVPVPGTLLLLGTGLLAGAGVSRRRKAHA